MQSYQDCQACEIMILETEGIAILVCKSLYYAAFLEVLSLYMIAYLKEKHKTVPQILKK